MHDLENHFRRKFGITSSRSTVDPKEWAAGFNTIKDTAGKARDTLLKLAITPISVFSPD